MKFIKPFFLIIVDVSASTVRSDTKASVEAETSTIIKKGCFLMNFILKYLVRYYCDLSVLVDLLLIFPLETGQIEYQLSFVVVCKLASAHRHPLSVLAKH